MANLLRGDVYWADLEPVKRPVLILSHPVFNSKSGTVIAVALTSSEPRGWVSIGIRNQDIGSA